MRTLAEIIEIIKSHKNFKEDAEVARLLNIKPKTFAAAKSRNSIPFEELITFCNQEGIDFSWLLTGQVIKKTIIVEGKRVQVPAKGEPGFYLREEEPTTPEEKRLHAVLIRVKYIYEHGSLEDKARVRGIVEEIYDTLVEKSEMAGKKEASKKGA